MKKYFVGVGRINDYKHPAPDRTTIRPGRGVFDDYVFTVYPTREFMIHALKKSTGGLSALVKDVVQPNMVIYPQFQKGA